MIKVSIIVPVYNVEDYLPKCLDSLVNQTLKEIEIIVVNDGSPDNSQSVIDEYVSKYPDKVFSFVKENGGQGSARNYGLLKIRGEYIGYVDSDDYVESDMFEKLYNKAISSDADITICGNYNVSSDYSNKDADLPIKDFDSDFDNAFFGKMAVWNKIYRKSILIDNCLLFREKVWYEDLAFTIKSILNSKAISFVDEPLYNYLLRAGSTMNNSNIKRNLEILDAFDDVLKYMDDNDFSKYYEKIEFLAIDHIYISAIVRILRANASSKLKKQNINILINYMNNNFSDFRKNIYLKKLSKNRKLIYNLINLKMFIIIKLIFKIKKGK